MVYFLCLRRKIHFRQFYLPFMTFQQEANQQKNFKNLDSAQNLKDQQ